MNQAQRKAKKANKRKERIASKMQKRKEIFQTIRTNRNEAKKEHEHRRKAFNQTLADNRRILISKLKKVLGYREEDQVDEKKLIEGLKLAQRRANEAEEKRRAELHPVVRFYEDVINAITRVIFRTKAKLFLFWQKVKRPTIHR